MCKMTDKLSPRIKRKLWLVILFLTILSLSYENDVYYGHTSLIQYLNEVYFENHLIIKGVYAANNGNAIEQGEKLPIHNEIINVNRNLNTVNSTWISTLDSTSLPTAILTDALIPDPIFYDYSVLTQVQKDRLFHASLEYLAGTEEEAIRIARSIGFVNNEGHPSNMCGPLALSILRDAGLIEKHIDLHQFWLLNPRDGYTTRAILEKTFPKEEFFWYRDNTPIDVFDFSSFPLFSGDFIYIYAGAGGTFEHMLAVTRVDEEGRAFTVMNQNTEEGYLISELMLYNPNDPGEGFFYELTDRSNMDIGITGFGGFQLWRPISPIEDKNPEQLTLHAAMETIFEEYGGDWHVIFKEVDGEVIYSRHARERIHPASTIKVPIAMLFFEAFDDEMPISLQEYLAERGTGGRTYEQLLRAMLVVSEEDATEILVEWIEERLRIRDTLEGWGLTETTINPRRTTAEETTRILEGLYQGMWIEPQARDFILELMSEYTSSDDGRLGVIRDQLPNGNIYNKRGSLAREWVIVADTAIIEYGEKAYIAAFFAYPNDEGDTTYEDLEAAIEEAAHLIRDYITANSLTPSDLLGSPLSLIDFDDQVLDAYLD